MIEQDGTEQNTISPGWTHTLQAFEPAGSTTAELRLTIIYHPDPSRLGDWSSLGEISASQHPKPAPRVLSRLEPLFCSVRNAPARALDDPYLSRRPLHFRITGQETLSIERQGCTTLLRVDGVEQPGDIALTPQQLQQGVVLSLAQRVVLYLQQTPAGVCSSQTESDYGLIGDGPALHAVREAIQQFGPLAVPVLIRGESGTGKELVARALHRYSPRVQRPFVAINAAAIPASLAAAEIFGARRGAYTGIDQHRNGYLEQAAAGSLFLDEVGDLPSEVQALLLRVIETRQYQNLGGGEHKPFKARLIAATDLDLEQAIAHDRFRVALYHRLSSLEIRLPALREQRQNIGRLFWYLLRDEAQQLDLPAQCLNPRPVQSPPWLPAEWLECMALASWPGNVRQLRNLARQFLVLGHTLECLNQDPRCQAEINALLDDTAAIRHKQQVTAPPAQPAVNGAARLREMDDHALIQLLAQHQWRVLRVAEALQVPRSSLYDRIHRSPQLNALLARQRQP